ncbi:indole-3-glycerol phosphate synthase TrpC [Puteibacter caeruleilacunae]|nr:indole-3-glycerol phosphate synthase TrpC [Puteibacter caeruleilacunae]
MNVLDRIVAHKKEEISIRRNLISYQDLEKYPLFEKGTKSMSASIKNPTKSGIIAEFKRESPSKGIINNSVGVVEVTKMYEEAGASGISVLTDTRFFGGNVYDLNLAAQQINIPIIRKDFFVDEFQILEAKAIGASAILLIAAVLTKQEISRLARFASSLGLESLLEVHSADELEKIVPEVAMVGVNNRNLKTFDVDVKSSLELVDRIPDEFVKISESGISQVETISMLRQAGYQGFLIGENFMRTVNPGEACIEFVKELNNLA